MLPFLTRAHISNRADFQNLKENKRHPLFLKSCKVAEAVKQLFQ